MARSLLSTRFAACLFGVAALLPCTLAQAQVRVQPNRITIEHGNRTFQTLTRNNARSDWTVTDAQGFGYGVTGYDGTKGGSSSGGGGTAGGTPVIIVGGYDALGGGGSSSGGGGTAGGTPVIIVGGYDDALNFLRTEFDAVITRDEDLGVDLVEMPGREDPIGFFFQILTTVRFRGHLLAQYFPYIEVMTVNEEPPPAPSPVQPSGQPMAVPNDPLYGAQWNVQATGLDLAQWHPVAAGKRPRMAIIDSGIGTSQRSHSGLDGVEVTYVDVAPTSGNPLLHGLNVTTLVADRNQDSGGIVGLLGGWGVNACFQKPTLTAQAPQVLVYNVGDSGPIGIYVARAIRLATRAGVDVINLSLHTAPSAMVEAAIERAIAAGVIVVASAGNYEPSASKKETRFPASVKNVIAVGAAGSGGAPSAFSATSGVTIYAPGEQIAVGGRNSTWVYASGTSFAAPHVAATVALMRAAQPALSVKDAEKALTKSADRGFLNALAALNHVAPARAASFPALTPGCNGNLSVAGDLLTSGRVPAETGLAGVFPNPARGVATVSVALTEVQHVRVALYDVLGREVMVLADAMMEAGTHRLALDRQNLSAGTYVVRMTTAHSAFSRPVALLD
jgi:membrane-anchored mycosin MYCP